MRARSGTDTLVPCACTIDTHGNTGRSMNVFLSKEIGEKVTTILTRHLLCNLRTHPHRSWQVYSKERGGVSRDCQKIKNEYTQ